MDNTELQRRLSRIEAKVDELPDRLDETYMRKDVAAAVQVRLDNRLDKTEGRVAKTEGHMEWATRLVLGAVVVALLSLVVSGTGAVQITQTPKPAANNTAQQP